MPGLKIIAGLESHGASTMTNMCECFMKRDEVDWSNLTSTMAQLSLIHPQLIGARMDDFHSGMMNHGGTRQTRAILSFFLTHSYLYGESLYTDRN